MAGAPVLLTHASSLEHETGSHPERAERLRAIERELAARGGLGWERRASNPATRDALLAVHPASHLERIQRMAESGGGMIDADTTVSAGSWEAALHAAGSGPQMVDLLLSGDVDAPRAVASAHRPPGHHCETDRAMGFCLLSNVAIAARHAVRAHGLERVLIVDWDVHHGNGTQQVLWSDPSVLFTSIHQSPLYPGTGSAHEIGAGAGEGFTVNLPVPSGSGDETFVSLVEHLIVPLAQAHRSQLILISAGFDAHADDPLASCAVSDAGFAAMAASLRAAADEHLGAPIGLMLEGGYDVDALARSFADTLAVLGAEATPAPPQLAEHPLTTRWRKQVAEYWPDLRR